MISRLLLIFMKASAFIVGHIPLGFTHALGRSIGRLLFRLDRKHREIALANLDLAYGDTITRDEKDRIALKTFVSLATLAFEFMRLPWLKPNDLHGYVSTEGRENLDRALEKGRGVIILTAHFGNWELLGVWLGLMGYRMDIVVRELDHPVMEEFVAWARTRSGNRIIYKERSMRKLLRQLSGNGLAGILIDQNVTWTEGVFVDFFGTLACTNKGPAILAASSGAAVIPTFIVRRGRAHTVVFAPEVEMQVTGERELDAIENTRRCTRAVEEMIRKHPDQWFWVHRRWKTRPLDKVDGGGGSNGNDAS